MFKVNLTEPELEQLKVLADFLLFDQHSERLTFPRFEECMGILTINKKFPLQNIFREICGENRKFITFPRLVRAYMEFKSNDKKCSLEFKKFFGYVFKEVLKDINQKTGRDIPGTTYFSTNQHKNRECLSEFRVYSNSENEIKGLLLEYDEFFKNEFVCPNSDKEKLTMKIDLHLKILEDMDNDGELDEDDVRDFITHVYGTVSTKIEFLGVKCSSGKMYYTGNPSIGTTFLLGKSKSKFHYLKLAMKDEGIMFIKPFFNESKTTNLNLDFKLEEILCENFFEEIEHVYEEEEHLKDIKDEKEHLKNVLVPILDDDYFYQQDLDDCRGDELCYFYSRFNFSDENGIMPNEEDLLHDLLDFTEEVKNNSTPEEKIIEKQVTTKPAEKWDKVSFRTLDISTVFTNSQNLEALVEKYREDIASGIEFKKNKRLKMENDKGNFYIKRIKKTNDFSEDESTTENEKALEKEFLNILKRSQDALKNLRSSEFIEDDEVIIEYYEEDEFGNIRKISGEEKNQYFPLDLKEVVAKWKLYSEYLKRKVIRFGLTAAFAISKAIDVLKNVENNFEDNTNSLKVKIKVFDILTCLIEKRRILKAFTESDGGLSFIKKSLINQIKSNENINLNNKLGNVVPVKKETRQSEFKLEDISKLSSSIAQMEKILTQSERKENVKRALSKKLEFYKKEKDLLVYKKLEEIKKEVTGASKVVLNKYKRQHEEKRKKLIEDRRENLKNMNEKFVKKPTVVTFGELDLPKDIEIYRSQKIVTGKKFSDDIFIPEKSSLCPIDEKGNWIFPEGIDETDLEDWETFQWHQVDKIFRSNDFQVFLKGVEAADIIQGSLGDCYFLSAVAGLCKFPELVEKLFLIKEKSEDGCYGVYLRINGLWELVLVDDFVPCFGNYKKKFAFSNANGNELWVLLIEKAWAKLNGSYAKTIAGQPSEVFDAICNAYTETFNISPHDKDLIWNKILDGKNNNYIMTAGTGMNSSRLNYDEVNLVVGHAYTVLGAEEIHCSGIIKRLVKIRNPWGNGEWSGDWSDNSPKWTPKLREQLIGEGTDDGVFFMSYEDFIKYYVTMGICKIHRDFTYSYMKFKKNDTLKPQVLELNVKEDTKTFIQLHQKNPRFLLANGKYGQPTLAFVLLVDEKFNYIASASGDSNNIAIEAEIKAGKYYLYSDINYRYVNSEELHGYNITTYSKHNISLTKCGGESSLNVFELLKKSVVNYAKTKLEPTKENDLVVYTTKGLSMKFPFTFTLIENEANFDMEIEFNLSAGKGRVKSACLFPESEMSDCEKVTKVLKSKQSEVFISHKFRPESRVETVWKAKTVFSDVQLEETTIKQGVEEELDEEGNITQKYYQHKGGYGLILSNKTKDVLKMKLEVENLTYNNSLESEFIFDIAGKSNKFFNLKLAPNAKNIAFNFNFAD